MTQNNGNQQYEFVDIILIVIIITNIFISFLDVVHRLGYYPISWQGTDEWNHWYFWVWCGPPPLPISKVLLSDPGSLLGLSMAMRWGQVAFNIKSDTTSATKAVLELLLVASQTLVFRSSTSDTSPFDAESLSIYGSMLFFWPSTVGRLPTSHIGVESKGSS